jgi:hypothetical protein
MAGRAGGNASRAPESRQRPNFAPALTARLGAPSRFMWRTAEGQLDEIQRNMIPVIRRVEDIMNRDLKNTYRSA